MKKTIGMAIVGLLACAGLAGAQTTFDCATYGTGCNNAIPATGTSGDMNTSVITVPEGAACEGRRDVVVDVDVAIQYDHTWNGDLTVRLTGPGSEGPVSAELWSNVGGSSDDMNVVIDDQSENGPISGRVLDGSSRQPEGGAILCRFNGGPGAGDWELDINDNAGGDSGDLIAWSVTISCDRSRVDGCADDGGGKGGRGLGSWANNGRGNGEDLPPPGQRGR